MMKSMGGRLARIAGAALLLLAGSAAAATPLVVPVAAAKTGAKITDTPVRFNREALELLSPGAEIELTLPDGSRHDYVYESSVAHGGGFSTWIARGAVAGDNERAIITYGPAGAWGWMQTPYGDYRIYPSGRGYDLVAKREAKSFAPKSGSDVVRVGPDDPGIAPLTGIPTIVDTLPVASMLAKGLKVAPTPTLQSDVMLIYTRDLADKLGVGLMPMLYNLVASLNQAYLDSEVAITLRLVNATMIDYPNTNLSGATLDGMRGAGANASAFQALTWGVGSLRNAVGADFVTFLRDGPTDTGGIGNLPSNPVIYPVSTVTSSTAYAVSNYCATGCEGIVAHEVGHNMGNHHDPATIAKDSPTNTVDETGTFSYSYGYYSCANGLTCNPFTAGGCGTDPSNYARCAGPTNINDFGTVMSYFSPKIMKFSNPALSNCVPQGGNAGAARACGGSVPAPATATTSNNALSMNNVRGALSAFRSETIASLPGSLQFTNTGYSGPEGGTLTFTVSRASGSSGAVSVSYTVTAGSGTAGTDFTAANGTLSWATGDSANKTFTATLVADALVEGIESITATLSNPTGATGVYLGHPTTATGLILEVWPVGTLGGIPTDPSGWSSPATPTPSSVPWAIVNDSAPVGDPGATSLKSGQIDFAVANRLCSDVSYGAVPCPSIIELTRTFAAGTVAYAYRVSSFPGSGFLEFLVDGVVVQSVSGVSTNPAADTGWQLFSTTITAGTHTLRWQYRPRFPFPCANAIPQGGSSPIYPGCLDRAWIDQLALPAASGGSTFALSVTLAGTGTGTVTSTPAGINCGSTCTANFTSGASVALSAAPAAGSTFGGWSGGGCSGTAGCTVSISAATAVTATFTAAANPPRLANISTRMQVLTGDNVLIGGFIIGGSAPKTVVVRARGPSLIPLGVPNALANPTLSLYSGQTVIASNDNFGTAANLAALNASGFAPSDANESAILTTLNPGAYTAIVSGVGGGTGVGIIEVFEVDALTVPLINIATRGQVLTGGDVMIGGFIIQGNGPQTVVVRARGPSLIPLGVPNAIANPTLQLFSGQTVIASNDNFGTASNLAALTASGFAPSNSLESAILITLNPGAYTAIVSGVGGVTGVGIVEVFTVP